MFTSRHANRPREFAFILGVGVLYVVCIQITRSSLLACSAGAALLFVYANAPSPVLFDFLRDRGGRAPARNSIYANLGAAKRPANDTESITQLPANPPDVKLMQSIFMMFCGRKVVVLFSPFGSDKIDFVRGGGGCSNNVAE